MLVESGCLKWTGKSRNARNPTIKISEKNKYVWQCLAAFLSIGALSLHFIATFMFSEVSVVQLWLQGYMHAHTNAVFGGKWLRCLSITLCCYCAVPPLISHSLSQLHMAQQVLPPTPCLSHSRTDYFTEYCVWSFQWEQKLNSVNAVTCTRQYNMGFSCES